MPQHVVLEAAHRVIGDRRGRVIAAVGLDGRQLAIVLEVHARRKITVLVLHQVRMIKPAGQRHPVHVPLARVIGAIAERLEEFGH